MRISLGGGGTDLPSYYTKHSGFVVSAAITRYVYITISDGFWPRIHLKYSKMEDVQRVDEIHHPIIREAMMAASKIFAEYRAETAAEKPTTV